MFFLMHFINKYELDRLLYDCNEGQIYLPLHYAIF